MSFFETPLRRYYYVRGVGALAIGGMLGVGVLFYARDQLGLILGLVVAAAPTLVGLFCLWKAKKAEPTTLVTLTPARASVPAQVAHFRRMLWMVAIAYPILTIWVAYDLKQLEAGAVKEASLPAPVVLIYEHLGYWPTVLTLIVVGMGACGFLVCMIRILERPKGK